MPYYSITNYTGDGTTDQFAVTFPYIDPSHVSVLVNGLSVSFSWVNSGLIQTDSTPSAGQNVQVKRTTPLGSVLVSFNDSSVETAADLNTADLQQLYISQEMSDKLDITLATIVAIAAGNGNVPTPGNPIDNSKVLTANAGTFSWSNNVAVSSVTTNILTVSGNGGVTGNFTVSGTITAGGSVSMGNGSVCTGQFSSVTVVASGSLTGPLISATADTASAVDVRWQKTVSGTPAASTANPQFDMQLGASATALLLTINIGTGPLSLVGYDVDGLGSARIRPCTHTIPNVSGSFDLGDTTYRFRNLHCTGAIESSMVAGPSYVTVVTDIQWNGTTGRWQYKTAQLPVISGTVSAWTDIAPDSDYVNV